MNTGISLLVAGIVAFVTGTGGTAVLQWFLNRSGRKAEAARQKAVEEKEIADRQTAARDKAVMLAEAQALAQRTALDSAHQAYEEVEKRCDRCIESLGSVRTALEAVLNAVDVMLQHPDDVQAVSDMRIAMRAARRTLWD